MIITITCNPAIDKTITSGNEVIFDVGGKGINVSKVLNNLNIKSLITGFVGKENKNVVTEDLDELELEHHFIEVDGRVRTNTKRIIDNVTYEDNEDGPIISNKNIDDLFDKSSKDYTGKANVQYPNGDTYSGYFKQGKREL